MEVERYHQTGSRILGVVGVVLSVVAGLGIVSGGVSGTDVALLAGAVLVAVLSWAALIRPEVRLTGDEVVLRNMLETVRIPLASVDEIRVSRVLAIRAHGQRFVSPAVSRPMHEMRGGRGGRGAREGAPVRLPDFVEERIRARVDGAISGELAPDVRREPAWAEIVLLVLSVLVLVAGLVL